MQLSRAFPNAIHLYRVDDNSAPVGLVGRAGADLEGVDGAGEFLGKQAIDRALALQAALAAEGLGDDLDAKMALAAGPGPGMAEMAVRTRR